MNNIVNGLPLGLRFYDSEDQQCRYKHTCQKGVHHNEYQYTDNCSLPPFQIIRNPLPSDMFDMYLHCSDEDIEYDINTLCPDLVASISLKTVGLYDYITYTGVHACCTLPFTVRTLVYIRLEDGTNTWFSEEFYIDPTGVSSGDTNYRLWMIGSNRVAPDLRIWK
jgi:hypothetical protein